jgi:hypothetical protein
MKWLSAGCQLDYKFLYFNFFYKKGFQVGISLKVGKIQIMENLLFTTPHTHIPLHITSKSFIENHFLKTCFYKVLHEIFIEI